MDDKVGVGPSPIAETISFLEAIRLLDAQRLRLLRMLALPLSMLSGPSNFSGAKQIDQQLRRRIEGA